MNWKLFFGLAIGIIAYTMFLLWSNTAKAEMPYTHAVFFSSDLRHLSCAFEDAPGWLCARTISMRLPQKDPRKKTAGILPKSDPRKHAAN